MVRREQYAHPGFTFMELVVAILILGMLAGIGVPIYLRWAEAGRETKTTSNLQLLKNEIVKFNIEHGKNPSRLQDLVERPKGDIGKKWKPYLDKLPKDGWNQELYYKITAGGKHAYELYSYGGPAGPEEPAERRISVWEI